MFSTRGFTTIAAVLGFVAVTLGAFAAHGLHDRLDAEMLAIFETAVRYQFYHVFALLASAWLLDRGAGKAATVAGVSFLVGILLFSGSLYVLALSGVRILGAITPFGGVAFLVGWTALAVAAWKERAVG